MANGPGIQAIDRHDLVVGLTDKSGKFVVSEKDKFQSEVYKHIEDDRVINTNEVKAIEEDCNMEAMQWKKRS